MLNMKTTMALGSMALVLGGCNAEAMTQAKLPEGETNLSCAAVIYAATNLVDDHLRLSGEDHSMSDYVSVMTKYGTAHAKAEGLDANGVLGMVKLEAYAMTGRTGSRSVVLSDAGAVKRAKACYGG